ncbi:hypothetical protein BH11BAC5_BH11BAC5_49060 [soil metagenome]
MSKEEIKYEINKVLNNFSDKALEELLSFIKEIDSKRESTMPLTASLHKILAEDQELLTRLAQ